MALKACKITKSNQSTLAARFNVTAGDEDDVLPISFWLVTEFGNDDYFDTVADGRFEETFDVKETLQNGFVAVEYV